MPLTKLMKEYKRCSVERGSDLLLENQRRRHHVASAPVMLHETRGSQLDGELIRLHGQHKFPLHIVYMLSVVDDGGGMAIQHRKLYTLFY
jgi:hypothetical protein